MGKQSTSTNTTRTTRLRDCNGRFIKWKSTATDFGISMTRTGKRYHSVRDASGRFTRRTVDVTATGKRYHNVRDTSGRFVSVNG
mgnify:CR=1 FL=1|jgi:hypothetical protein